MLADCRSALMAVFVVDEAPLLPRFSVATTVQQQKGKASALTVPGNSNSSERHHWWDVLQSRPLRRTVEQLGNDQGTGS